MESTMDKMTINGVTYIKEGTQSVMAEKTDGMTYAIIRTYSAGVFAGYIKKMDVKYAEIVNSRRLWRWVGAASLSQLAIEGVKNPSECKFGMVVPLTILTEVIEVIPITEVAKKNIDKVAVWKV